ncbi:MAG: hypothetical protein GXP04_12320 [Alphaproteobacteria bacterium]|nr:hypothetical protein [Alphaproteobacteria bacterium]
MVQDCAVSAKLALIDLKYGSPDCRKKEQIEQLSDDRRDAKSVRSTSGKSERAVPPDRDIEQKKNPPAVTDGLNENDFEYTRCDTFSTGFHRIHQARYWVQHIISEYESFERGERISTDLSADDIKDMSEDLAQGVDIYRDCYPTIIRDGFEDMIGVKFERFEDALLGLGTLIGEPVHWAGGFL